LKMKISKRNLALTQPKAKQIASKKCDASGTPPPPPPKTASIIIVIVKIKSLS